MGSTAGGWIANAIGPKRGLAWFCLPILAGSCVSSLAQGPRTAYLGRFIGGLGAGGMAVGVPRYLTEIAPVPLRGVIGTGNQLFVCLGILLAYLLGLPYAFGVESVHLHRRAPAHMSNRPIVDVAWWRLLLSVGALLPIPQLMLVRAAGAGCSHAPARKRRLPLSRSRTQALVVPESPCWHESRGHIPMADINRRRLWGEDATPRPRAQRRGRSAHQALVEPLLGHSRTVPAVDVVVDEGPHGLQEEVAVLDVSAHRWPQRQQSRTGGNRLWAQRGILALCLGIGVTQQASGINVLIFYSSRILEASGM